MNDLLATVIDDLTSGRLDRLTIERDKVTDAVAMRIEFRHGDQPVEGTLRLPGVEFRLLRDPTMPFVEYYDKARCQMQDGQEPARR